MATCYLYFAKCVTTSIVSQRQKAGARDTLWRSDNKRVVTQG